MKRIFFLSILIAAAFLTSYAQAKDWETDFDHALSSAEKTKKYMLVYFSGSDWCGWCKKLDKEVFSNSKFKTYARRNLICIQLDFPRKKTQSKKLREQNRELAMKFGVRGYPTVFVISPRGDLVARTGYQAGGAESYVEHLRGFIEAYQE